MINRLGNPKDKMLTIRRDDGCETVMYVLDCNVGVGTKLFHEGHGLCTVVAEREMNDAERAAYEEVMEAA